MSLKLYYHPLSSFCHKVLIALYESATPFEPVLVDLGDETSRREFLALWPVGKFPVLHDVARDHLVPESSIIIEYLARHHPGATALVDADPDLARQERMRDRFYDLHLHQHMQKIIGDRLRPADRKDPFGVQEARTKIRVAYAMIEQDMATKEWAMGGRFGMADCAAAPALFYADRVAPLGPEFPNAAAYLERLKRRASYARVLEEAAPYFPMIPQ